MKSLRKRTQLQKVKKLFVFVLAFVMLFTANIAFASAADRTKTALPIDVGLEMLRQQFEYGVSDECNGYALDYHYYSPAGENDREKYPVVIYLHGIGHGSYVGSQLADSTMPYWASRELQSKWTDTGGAYILLPRCPEDELQYWSKTFVDPLRTLIDSFIRDHAKNVDTTRIFVGGSSAGGEMTWDLAIKYPEYFAGIYPLAATGTRSDEDIKAIKDVSVWCFASTLDPLVNYNTNVIPQWDKICKYSTDPANSRLSSFGTVMNPDGTKGDSNHRLYTTISYDFFTVDGEPYPNVITVNGKGRTVKFEDSKGMIYWMSNTHSSFDGIAIEGESETGLFGRMFISLRNIMFRIANVIQKLLGFV